MAHFNSASPPGLELMTCAANNLLWWRRAATGALRQQELRGGPYTLLLQTHDGLTGVVSQNLHSAGQEKCLLSRLIKSQSCSSVFGLKVSKMCRVWGQQSLCLRAEVYILQDTKLQLWRQERFMISWSWLQIPIEKKSRFKDFVSFVCMIKHVLHHSCEGNDWLQKKTDIWPRISDQILKKIALRIV